MPTFATKQGSTGKSIQCDLFPSDTNLTSATVTVYMRNRKTGVLKISGAAATIVSNTAPATVRYDFTAADLDTAGTFDFEWRVVNADTTVDVYPDSPSDPYVTIIITEALA